MIAPVEVLFDVDDLLLSRGLNEGVFGLGNGHVAMETVMAPWVEYL